ncbi:GHKL domain-containing protein [Sphingobacteriales bacterium UPWRP_1]|nr:hypothetical protein B6N25_08100 [Sphingobacteriales bacterium TSM_CSS]PSJ72338.1 GHKL domain-containing protein [Sphingobacteriales bacterium UPWRP_1]
MDKKISPPQTITLHSQPEAEVFERYRQQAFTNPSACIDALKRALPVLNQQTNASTAAHVYLALANCYKVLEDYAQALQFYSEAINLARQSGAEWAYAEALEQAQLVCVALNNHAAAYNFATELNRWLKTQLQHHKIEEDHLWSQNDPADHLQHIEKQRAIIERQHTELQRFGYIVAHDLKEPLHVVSGFSSLINYKFHHTFTPELKELFGYISGGVKQMHDKLDDLLDYVHIDPNPVVEIVNAHATVNKVKAMFTHRINELQANVILQVGADDTLYANPTMLTSLLYRLIDNALKFTRQQPAKVTIAIGNKDAETMVTISDNGIGIEPEYHERIFHIFTQLKRQHGSGTGMGLAICRKIVEAHGGKIWVESVPHSGSTFTFTLPHKKTPHNEIRKAPLS